MSTFERIGLVSFGLLLLIIGGAIAAVGGADLLTVTSRAQLNSDAPVFVGGVIAAVGIAAVLAGALDLSAKAFMLVMLALAIATPPTALLLAFGSVAPTRSERVTRCAHRYTNELSESESFRQARVADGCERLAAALGWSGRAPGGLKGVLAARASD